MKSRTGLVLAVVLVLGLAGCSGLSPFGSGTSYPDGYNESGITDAETAVDQHTEAVSEYDSYTEETIVTDSEVERKTTFWIDEANERVAVNNTISSDDGTVMRTELYQDDNTTYGKTEVEVPGFDNDPDPVYNTSNESFSSSTEDEGESNTSDLERWLEHSNFDEAETVDRDGETLYRYNATDVDDPEAFLNVSNETTIDDVESFDATLEVDEEGTIRSFAYDVAFTADGETQEVTGEVDVTDIDSTSVEEPDWVEEAESDDSASFEDEP